MSSLPYGTSTYSRGWPAFGTDAPLYISHNDGWRCFTPNGDDYCDMIMGLGAIILGHRNPHVDEAIRRQLTCGTTMSLGTMIELEAANRLLMHFPDFCQVQWGVNGSDATTGAVRLAKAVTGRRHILIRRDGYHGFHDWALAGTSRSYGIPDDNFIHRIDGVPIQPPFLAEMEDDIAAMIVEPDLHPGDLKQTRHWCSQHGALMICDEVMTWQRYPEWTASAHHGVIPDLWCLGKSLANGMPVSAIVGNRDLLMRFSPGSSSPLSPLATSSKNTVLPNAFFSSTWAGHPLSMAAVIATLDVMEKENGPQKIWAAASELDRHLVTLVERYAVRCNTSSLPWNRITWPDQRTARLWRKLMAEHGVLIYGAHNLSLAHDQNAFHRIHEAWKNTVQLLPERLASASESDEVETTGVMRR